MKNPRTVPNIDPSVSGFPTTRSECLLIPSGSFEPSTDPALPSLRPSPINFAPLGEAEVSVSKRETRKNKMYGQQLALDLGFPETTLIVPEKSKSLFHFHSYIIGVLFFLLHAARDVLNVFLYLMFSIHIIVQYLTRPAYRAQANRLPFNDCDFYSGRKEEPPQFTYYSSREIRYLDISREIVKVDNHLLSLFSSRSCRNLDLFSIEAQIYCIRSLIRSPLDTKLDAKLTVVDKKGLLLLELFELMRMSTSGDWRLRKFTSEYPDCVNWVEPTSGMVPLLYAFDLKSRWLVRHFIQLDKSKIHYLDLKGRNIAEVAADANDVGLMYYAINQLSETPSDPLTHPLPLNDIHKALPDGIEGLTEFYRRFREQQERTNNSINNNVYTLGL